MQHAGLGPAELASILLAFAFEPLTGEWGRLLLWYSYKYMLMCACSLAGSKSASHVRVPDPSQRIRVRLLHGY